MNKIVYNPHIISAIKRLTKYLNKLDMLFDIKIPKEEISPLSFVQNHISSTIYTLPYNKSYSIYR